jgi:hypothetical protein
VTKHLRQREIGETQVGEVQLAQARKKSILLLFFLLQKLLKVHLFTFSLAQREKNQSLLKNLKS